MADENKTSAVFKRHEQLKRWEESDTNRCPNTVQFNTRKVKFQDGCVFLAACSSGDCDEVERLLERGADINTANIDGLTALHQACIDDNLDMVEFLVQHKADVDVCDNEGWTPLHATASCGFTEIARYLLGHKCNVAAVNNDGDLPFDICEDDDMEKLLQEAMETQGVDADAARREEEDRMMEDANQWLNSTEVPDHRHPKTGATSLHVAAAKGYIKVITVLLESGVNIDEKDNDGWTPLHAAAHWGQEESCKILSENMCDMEAKNLAGQTPFDVADTELIKLLEELKLKQASAKDQQKDLQKDIIQTRLPSSRRSRNDPARSSVTRMSVEQKHNMMKTDQDRLPLDGKMPATKEEERVKTSSSSCSEEETSESETEKKNEINKQTSDQNQPRDRDKPPIVTTVEIKEKQEMPTIDENNKSPGKENIKNLVDDEADLKKDVEMIGDGLKKLVDDKISNENTDIDNEKENKELEKNILKKDIIDEEKTNTKEEKVEQEKELIDENKGVQNNEKKEESNREEKKKDIKDENEDKEKDDKFIENATPRKEREPVKRTVSAPGSVQEVPKISINSKYVKDGHRGDNDIPSWRLGLRKTGSTSMVPHDSINTINEDDKPLPRSASSPRLAEENENKKNESSNDKPTRRPFVSSSSFSAADHNNSNNSDRLGSSQGVANPYRYSGSSQNSTSSYTPNYVPFYKRQQAENERKERERAGKEGGSRISAPTSLPVTSTNVTSPTISTTSSTTTITTPTSSFIHHRKSYEPPKRDEETEMQRKVRAKRARESRRSTQGVTLEEVQQANEVLRKTDNNNDQSGASTTTATTTTTGTWDRNRISDTRKPQDVTDSSSSNISDRLSSDINSVRRTQSSNESDLSSVSSWRKSRAEREDASKKEDETRSFRRSRVERDLSHSAPNSSLYSTDSTYVPRNQRLERNALSTDLSNTSLGTSANLTRSASLRTDRIRTADEDPSSRIELRRDRETDKKISEQENNEKEKEEKRPESTAIRNRRMRRERRSTGIANLTAEAGEEEDKDKENKEESKDESKADTTEDRSAGRFNRHGSASDVPSYLSDKHTTRPSSYSEYSRSAPALDKDYKRLYEEEKIEKERLKRDLDQCKKELREAKTELDRQMKKNEANRVTDTNDKREKRALERKLSELEEEIKKMEQLKEDNRRLREENGALIRVISKLSK